METHKPLLKDKNGEDLDEHLYRSMIGSLMYLTSSRPNIMFAICACARFQVAFTNSDYAGASLDRKSTTGGCQFIGCRLISSQCKKQIVVANSITEVEYIAASNCYGQRIIHKGWSKWNATAAKDGIGVKTGNSRVNAVGHYLVLLGKKLVLPVDFLNAHPIRYALTVNPTIYVSYIELFWSTAKAKTINEETQIHATVDGKKIVITQSSVWSDLQLAYDDGINFEPIFVPSSTQPKKTHRPRKAKRATEISQSSGPIPLVADKTVTKERGDRMERAATTASSLEVEQDNGSGPRCQDTILRDAEAQTRLKLKELMDLCTKLSDRVLDLETTKTAQAKEIANLKKGVKKLERKRKSKTLGMNLFKIGISKRRSLGEEDASKQGKNLKQGKQRSIFEESDFDDEGFDADMNEVFKDVEGDVEQVISVTADEVTTGDAVNTAGIEVNTASALITTTGVSVTTAEPITTASEVVTTTEPSTPPPTTTTTVIEDEDLTIAQTLMKMKSEKSKVRGVVLKEPSETATRPIVPPQ
ncbi:hypothetical protein Tco_1450254 [Tanacetum coccineum]